MRHPCSTCRREATRTITGQVRGKSLYSATSCDTCTPKHRALAQKAGPVVEEPLEREQDALF